MEYSEVQLSKDYAYQHLHKATTALAYTSESSVSSLQASLEASH